MGVTFRLWGLNWDELFSERGVDVVVSLGSVCECVL